MAKYPGARVAAGQLVGGFQLARKRFSEGVRQPEPDPGFFALFESLNWAIALDDLIREIWVPAGEQLGRAWGDVARGEGLPELLDGTRYARNLVHHHWADALRLEQGRRYPTTYPEVYFSWVWREAADLPEHPDADKPHVIRNRAAYDSRLAGVRTEDTLMELGEAFTFVGNLLDPPRPSRSDAP
jgi:hypothetical protein